MRMMRHKFNFLSGLNSEILSLRLVAIPVKIQYVSVVHVLNYA